MRILLYLLLAPLFVFAQGEQRYADGTATDQDGNTFEWINYGTQDWAIENAEVVTYRDGTQIPQVTGSIGIWGTLTTGAWCYYKNDSSKGKLYNWYAVMGIHDTASLSDPTLRKEFAPEGWHVPTDTEWTILEEYLIANGYNYDGSSTGNKIAKAMASKSQWRARTSTGSVGNDLSLNNSSGFNAFPDGNRFNTGGFNRLTESAIFWTSTSNSVETAFYRYLNDASSSLLNDSYDMVAGFSVRLVRNNSNTDTDTERPVITLVGESTVYVNQGTAYSDAGATATDNFDGNISANIITTSTVNTAVAGTYTVTYTVSDAAGNAAIPVVRTVNVLGSEQGVIFDQNGNAYNTVQIGEQIWTVQTGQMTTYRDGTPIPEATNLKEWVDAYNEGIGVWCWHPFHSDVKMYNRWAIEGRHDTDDSTPNKILAPGGFRLPGGKLSNYITVITDKNSGYRLNVDDINGVGENIYPNEGNVNGILTFLYDNGYYKEPPGPWDYEPATYSGTGPAKSMASVEGWNSPNPIFASVRHTDTPHTPGCNHCGPWGHPGYSPCPVDENGIRYVFEICRADFSNCAAIPNNTSGLNLRPLGHITLPATYPDSAPPISFASQYGDYAWLPYVSYSEAENSVQLIGALDVQYNYRVVNSNLGHLDWGYAVKFVTDERFRSMTPIILSINDHTDYVTIYPNPTTSILTIDGGKDYQIKVYDLLGNKVLETQGNSINMGHLSTATYIVKATDKSNNEELTYKVVKN